MSAALALALLASGCGGGSGGGGDSLELGAAAAGDSNTDAITLPADETGSEEVVETIQATAAEPDNPEFDSATTTGFSAQLLDDGSLELSWVPVAYAETYEVYKNDELLVTTSEPVILDRDPEAGPQTYQITAVDSEQHRELVADGLEVVVTEELIASLESGTLSLGAANAGSDVVEETEDNTAVSYTHLTLPTICSV